MVACLWVITFMIMHVNNRSVYNLTLDTRKGPLPSQVNEQSHKLAMAN